MLKSSQNHTHSPGGLLSSVEVYNVLHQQVPLQTKDSMAVQDHLMAARRTAKPTATDRHAGGAAGLPQGVSWLDEDKSKV